MNQEVLQQNDEILGYTLVRKIGAGGYGDVWEAVAPGGLKKAIKMVHGFHDESRARSELKAIDRIKEARHPFMLSLERIEIHQSQLIIVSELADKSLADLVNEYGRRGEGGIPRDELIRYMREAGDALDYLNSDFGLQHLDVKPENILLVAGHAKVADFGLVKDLRDVSQSMMSGMTPAYAAPELFDGRPGPASDQYSLATVYQEMLTMARPFQGSTPAQLAAQHMHGKPNLVGLPISDQPVVAKALSKDPSDRYRSCLQFVEQLENRKTRKRVVKGRINTRQVLDTTGGTVAFDDSSHSKQRTQLFSNSNLTFNSLELDIIDPPDGPLEDAVFQPTIVIGLGQSGTQVVQKIKERMVARHGSMNEMQSLNLLCIDSDLDSLAKISLGQEPSSMRVNETLAVPLRRSDQYRERQKLDLSWISRRWIYNVPRSLQTEGLRPFGRIVFVDHFEAICEKLSNNIKQVMKAENIATTCEALGIDPPKKVIPKVILVTSISGGIGSGMANDLAYATRLMMAEQGITESEHVGILLFGHESIGREAGLSTANAYAFLTELRHFADGGFPGDARLGVPEFDDELPFDHTYFFQRSGERDNLAGSDLDTVAEYVCLSSTTRCSTFFDACRKIDGESQELGLRSFGVSVCGPGREVQGLEAVKRLSKNLIQHWVGEDSALDLDVAQFAKKNILELGLELEQATMQMVRTVSEVEDQSSIDKLVEGANQRLVPSSNGDFGALEHYFDTVLDIPYWRRQSVGSSTDYCLAVDVEVNAEAQIVGDKLSSRILALLNRNTVSLYAPQKALESCRGAIVRQHDRVMAGLLVFGTRMQEMQVQFEQRRKHTSDEKRAAFHKSFIDDYAQIRFQEFVLRCCCDYYHAVKSCLNSSEGIIKRFRMQIEAVGQDFQAKERPKRTAKYTPTIQQMLIDSIESSRDQLVRQTEQIVLNAIVDEGQKFLDVLSDSVNWQNELPALIRDAAQSVLSNAFKQISIDEVIAKSKIQPAALLSWLNEQMSAAKPSVTTCGGSARVLLGHPQNAKESQLSQTIEQGFSVTPMPIHGTTGDLAFCFEAENIRLANLAFGLLKQDPETVEVAKRIHSRNDINWTTLSDLF